MGEGEESRVSDEEQRPPVPLSDGAAPVSHGYGSADSADSGATRKQLSLL